MPAATAAIKPMVSVVIVVVVVVVVVFTFKTVPNLHSTRYCGSDAAPFRGHRLTLM